MIPNPKNFKIQSQSQSFQLSYRDISSKFLDGLSSKKFIKSVVISITCITPLFWLFNSWIQNYLEFLKPHFGFLGFLGSLSKIRNPNPNANPKILENQSKSQSQKFEKLMGLGSQCRPQLGTYKKLSMNMIGIFAKVGVFKTLWLFIMALQS